MNAFETSLEHLVYGIVYFFCSDVRRVTVVFHIMSKMYFLDDICWEPSLKVKFYKHTTYFISVQIIMGIIYFVNKEIIQLLSTLKVKPNY